MSETSCPIILMSSERSGSNLLRVLFGNHSNVCAPVAPQLCIVFMHVLEQYGDLSRPAAAIRMLDHMVIYSRHEFSGWGLELSGEALYERFRPTSFLHCLHAVYQANAEFEGKKTFFSKENEIHLFAPIWRNEFPRSKFIYLARDPRDYVASWKKRPQNFTLTPFLAASRWAEDQRSFFKWQEAFHLPVSTVTYEALVKDSELEMSRLLKYCDLEVESACFETQPERNTEAYTNEYWQNLAKPIMKENSKKYRQELSEEEVYITESINRVWMQRLGYSFDTKADWRPSDRFKKLHKKQRKRAKRLHGKTMQAYYEKNIASRERLLEGLLAE